MTVQWGLGAGNNALASFGYGVQLGQGFSQQQAEKEHRNALLGLRQQELAGEQAKMTAQAQEQDIRRRAAAGDKEARALLAGIDFTAWEKLTDNDKAALDAQMGAMGQAALRISQLPQDQQPAAWDAAVDQLSQSYPAVAEYRGRYSPDALMSILDQSKLVGEFLELERPRWTPITEGGTLVNTADPAAIQQYMESLGNVPPPPAGFTLDVPGGSGGNAAGGFPGR